VKEFLISALSLLLCASLAWGAADGEALFKEGKYKDAAQAFADKDMENPQDVRWRYNRGVASYMAEDMEAAQSAFASAGVRSKDPEIQFRSAYNLGATLMKDEDYEKAAKEFQKALALNPQDEDAKENLKLALWRQAQVQQQQNQEQQGDQQGDQQQQQDGRQGDQNGQGQDSQSKDKQDGKQQGDQDQKQSGDQQQKSQGEDQEQGQDQQQQQSESAQGRQQDQQDEQSAAQAGDEEKQDQANLDGRMQALNKPEQAPQDQDAQAAMSSMEKKMADTLLDNVKENRVFRPDNKSAIISDDRANSGKRW
jgi:Ca-activated chloride channel family protein